MRFRFSLGENRFPRAAWWPERLGAVLAIAGVVLSLLPGFSVRTWAKAGSDYKTVYASGKLFLRGAPAYNFPNLETIFREYGVVLPPTWYAHAPVYMPFTFAALSPVLALPMVASVYVWTLLSAISLVFAVWALADHSDRSFGLSRRWRLLLIVVVAAVQIVSFGLELGNLCVLSAALCVMAVMYTDRLSSNWTALLLTLSLLLKPHLAVGLMAGMILSRNRRDRALVIRTVAFFAAAVAVFALIFFHRQLGMQWGGYLAMVREEIGSGSMNAHNNELLPQQCQITSLSSLLGYLLPDGWTRVLSLSGLAAMLGVLIYATRQPANNSEDTRLEMLGAWSTLGLLATYHRTDDGIVLFVMLPWLLVRWRRAWYDPVAWSVMALLVLMGAGQFPPDFSWFDSIGLPGLARFLVFRQSALLLAVLMIVLLAHLIYQVHEPERAARNKGRTRTGSVRIGGVELFSW